MALDKATQDALNDKNTIVIIPEVGDEYKIVNKWLKSNASRVITEQRVFTELHLGTLQTDVNIMCVTRNFEMPTRTEVVDNDGRLHYPSRPDAELAAEVCVSEPIRCSKFWIRDNPMRPGRPDTAGILEALNQAVSPWRLDFVDKGENKPQILKLTKV